MSVKCGLLTDKSAKIGSLSVNLSEILADCPKNKKYVPSQHVFLSLFSCVRAHKRSASHLVLNRVQTSNKAHDKFVPRRDCACADHSRPSLSTALLSGWSSHLVLIGFRLTFTLSQARTPWTRQARLRSPKACVRAHKRSASHLVLSSFILTKSFVKMPATFFSINSFASFSSSIVQMR